MSDSQSQQFQGFFSSLFTDAVSRAEGASAEYAKMESRSAEQARQWIDEGARLARETVGYQMALTDQWRKLAFETMRKSLEVMTPKTGG